MIFGLVDGNCGAELVADRDKRCKFDLEIEVLTESGNSRPINTCLALRSVDRRPGNHHC